MDKQEMISKIQSQILEYLDDSAYYYSLYNYIDTNAEAKERHCKRHWRNFYKAHSLATVFVEEEGISPQIRNTMYRYVMKVARTKYNPEQWEL